MIERLATPTIELLDTEYPNGLRLELGGPPQLPITPKGLYPAFYGCYDWHSAVHSHWQLVRAIRHLPNTAFASLATWTLDEHLTAENVATEMEWVAERPSFEMPYGMAWVLTLCDELRRWESETATRPQDDTANAAGLEPAGRWLEALAPLEVHAAQQFERYCQTMTTPMRGGLHNQSAFSLGLVHDWAVRSAASQDRLARHRGLRRCHRRNGDPVLWLRCRYRCELRTLCRRLPVASTR